MSSPKATPSLGVPSRKRKYSEISGLNVDGPVKRSRHSGEEEETILWTTVKKYLENPTRRPQPSVSCPICLYPIAIRGVPILEPCPWKLANGSQTVGAVLPCAHILCFGCYNGHIAAQEEMIPDGTKNCPCCRFELLYSGCFHIIPAQRVPIATYEDASMVPLTMPELQPGLEHRFPETCFECTTQAAEEYVEISLRFVSEIVHGVGYVFGEGPPEWNDAVELSLHQVWNYMEYQHSIPSWRNGHVPAGLLQVSFAGKGADLPQASDASHSDSIVYSREGEVFWYVPVHRDDGPY